jgi:hypothetical protein
MTKQSPKPGDMNQRMWAVAQQAAGLDDSPVKDQKAVERGRLGGVARAKALSAERRVKIAKAARASRGVKAAPARKAALGRKAPRKRI